MIMIPASFGMFLVLAIFVVVVHIDKGGSIESAILKTFGILVFLIVFFGSMFFKW